MTNITKNMMKNIAKATICALMVTSVSSCDENSWNDEHLKGFETPEITVKKTVSDTLGNAQVKKLAQMKANIELATANGNLEQLQAVAASGLFNSVITPELYAPAYLDSIAGLKSSKIYYLEKNSTVKLYFPTIDGMPDEMALIPQAYRMTVSEEQYQMIWDSEDDYANCFTPAKKPEAFIPGLLNDDVPDPEETPFAVVTYNYCTQEPNFGGSNPPAPEFELSNIIGTIKPDKATYTANGVVTGICAQGFILTDLSGSVLVYYGSSFDLASYAIGQQRTVTGTGSSYGAALQLVPVSDELKGTQEYTYPTPEKVDGAALDNYLTNLQALKADNNGMLAKYVEIEASDITVSGKYINFAVAGASKAQGSVYQSTAAQQALVKDLKSGRLCGYLTSTSGAAYVNITLVSVNGKAPEYSAPMFKAPAQMASTVMSDVYKFDGSKWAIVPNTVVLNPSDYAEMGLSSNLNSTQASQLLPIFLTRKYPYAQKGDVKYVVYNYYNGSETERNFCSSATFDGKQWLISNVHIDMMQFVCSKDASTGRFKWMYDPSIYITIPGGRNATSAPFWQKCVDFVYENYDVPFFNATSITSGVGYVTSFGNNEYFAGTSAYQCNVDIRPSAARKQVPSIYGSMSDEQVVATLKSNFENIVMPAVLAQEYPEAMPGTKVDQYYVITFTVYDGTTSLHTIRYLVSAPGTFTFTDCTWNQ